LPAGRFVGLFQEELAFSTNIWYFCKNQFMSKNTSISLGDHFESFISKKVGSGRYHSASEVIRDGLRLLEQEERKVEALKAALELGEKSGIAQDFNAKNHLKSLHAM
jgi:antitoxin ParD1/3/4